MYFNTLHQIVREIRPLMNDCFMVHLRGKSHNYKKAFYFYNFKFTGINKVVALR